MQPYSGNWYRQWFHLLWALTLLNKRWNDRKMKYSMRHVASICLIYTSTICVYSCKRCVMMPTRDCMHQHRSVWSYPDSKVYRAYMGPTWGRRVLVAMQYKDGNMTTMLSMKWNKGYRHIKRIYMILPLWKIFNMHSSNTNGFKDD